MLSTDLCPGCGEGTLRGLEVLVGPRSGEQRELGLC